MNIRKVTYALYILVIMFLMGYSIFSGFYELKFGNFIEKEIVASKIYSNILRGGDINYTIVDRENNTYFFNTAEVSEILSDYDVIFGESSVFIKYNVRNNEILEVSNGHETEKKKFFTWLSFIIWLITLSSVILILFIIYLRKIAIRRKLLKENIGDTE